MDNSGEKRLDSVFTGALTELLESLFARVEELSASGVLNKGQANSLIKKLESAEKAIEKGQKSASNKVGAFINEVEAFVNSGRLTPDQGQPMIDAANAIIALL